MKLCNNPPNEIKELFKQTYPKLEANTYALLQNAYTSLFAHAVVTYGYWIHASEDEFSDEFGCNLNGTYIMSMTIRVPARTLEKEYTDKQFIGAELGEILSNEDTDPSDLHKNAKRLCKKYNVPNNTPSRSDLLTELRKIDPQVELSSFPILCVLPLMCYCCT
jgi:hypothetical protein